MRRCQAYAAVVLVSLGLLFLYLRRSHHSKLWSPNIPAIEAFHANKRNAALKWLRREDEHQDQTRGFYNDNSTMDPELCVGVITTPRKPPYLLQSVHSLVRALPREGRNRVRYSVIAVDHHDVYAYNNMPNAGS